MGSMNKVLLIGHVGGTPEVRRTAKGTPVANFSMATNSRYQNSEGELVNQAEWHRIVAYGKTAELCQEHLSKGKQILVEGRIQTRSWDDEKGRHWMTEIILDHLLFLDRKEGAEPQPAQPEARRTMQPEPEARRTVQPEPEARRGLPAEQSLRRADRLLADVPF